MDTTSSEQLLKASIETVEQAKQLILRKADEIRATVDRSGFCKPDCEACLRATAKGLIDTEYGIENSIHELIEGSFWKFTPETITDQALFELRT